MGRRAEHLRYLPTICPAHEMCLPGPILGHLGAILGPFWAHLAAILILRSADPKCHLSDRLVVAAAIARDPVRLSLENLPQLPAWDR